MGIIAMNYSDSADEPAGDCGPAVKITLQKWPSTSGEVILEMPVWFGFDTSGGQLRVVLHWCHN